MPGNIGWIYLVPYDPAQVGRSMLQVGCDAR
jgi:hypothetical protein